jgi:hypothetical protein
MSESVDLWIGAGYGKMPDYEFVLTDFLLNLARSKGQKFMGILGS